MFLKPIFSLISLSLAAAAACSPGPAEPMQAAMEDSGADLAQRLCSACHATGADDLSQHPEAPPFRTLNQAYPVEYLAEAFAEGIIVGHPDMPVFELDPDQIRALLLYLEEVQSPASPAD